MCMEENNEATRVCVICDKEKSIKSFNIIGKNKYRNKICKICFNMGLRIKDIETSKETRECPACKVTKPINQF